MVAVIASIFRSWFDCSTGSQLTTNGRYIEAFIFAVRLTTKDSYILNWATMCF